MNTPANAYREAYRRALEDPEGFWGERAMALHWERCWDRVLDASRAPFYRWFTGGRINTCYNALDRHIEQGRGEQAALIYDSPVTGTAARLSYRELRDRVAHFAGALAAQGVGRGDRVVIYMPMVPEAVVAMLACARIGAVHSVVFGGFAAHELAKRIDDAQPVMVISASCGIEGQRVIAYKPLLDEALRLASHTVKRCIVLQRPQVAAALEPGRDLEWSTALAGAAPAPCASLEATDALYILYTSGTTGKPKGVVRDHGGHAVALAWSMGAVYDMRPGDVFWAASDVGWVVGHSYIVYAPLLAAALLDVTIERVVTGVDAPAREPAVEGRTVCIEHPLPAALPVQRRGLLAPETIRVLERTAVRVAVSVCRHVHLRMPLGW